MGFIRNMALVGAATLAAAISSPASAAMWQIDSVYDGTYGGFGASSFHFAGENPSGINSDHDGSVMTGSSLGDISGAVGGIGQYDSDFGTFFGLFELVGSAGVFELAGNLLFGTNGTLSSPTFLGVDFASITSPLPAGLSNDDVGFKDMRVCCSGTTRPNSFTVASGGQEATMALWGANGWTGSGYSGSTIGMDLRLKLTLIPEIGAEVPVPAALPLFGTGLALMGFLGWRRKRKA